MMVAADCRRGGSIDDVSKNLMCRHASEMRPAAQASVLPPICELDAGTNAPLPIVDADPKRLKQVVRNIVDNAIKYSPLGGLIVVRCEVRRQDVVVTISDQGVGISPEDLIPLFEKYFRVKAPTGVHVPGTGLGLPVAREIVEAHGGRIWAESKVGEGTSISFSIPLQGRSDSLGIETGQN